MRHKISEILPIKEAMDNLAAIASINMESPPPIGIVDNVRLVTSADELESSSVRWLSGEGAESLLQVLDLTYRSVYQNLMSLYENPMMDWESEKSREGISAMMSLVGESVQKMNAYLEFRLDQKESAKIEQREAFRALQRFYSERFTKKFVGGIEGAESWENAWHEKNSLLEATGLEIQDFESLLRDKEYELFYVASEEGAPYLDETLLRNLKLTVDFDLPSGSFEEDPFLKVKAILDRDIQASSSWMVRECSEEISQFYKVAKKIFHHPCAALLSKAIIALLLASNTQHLLSRTTGKSCMHYFNDFHQFLRSAMKSDDYQKWVTYPPSEREVEAYTCTSLILKLCYSFVHRPCGVKQEAIGLIHRTMRRGNEIEPKSEKGNTPWSKLLLDDEKFRTLLHKFPSGPLLKILDTVRLAQEEGITTPFDPWIQGNLPQKLYTIRRGKQEVELLSFAAPVRQPMISRVEIIDEFRGFLRYLKQTEKKHLLVNLQDRFSWRESARSKKLEELQNTPLFSDTLFVMTLPKETDFYYQRNAFSNLNDANAFFAAFKEQIASSEQNGFYFPKQWKQDDLMLFSLNAFSRIHTYVFENKNVLTRAMREDFIEIFYQLLILEAMERFQVDSLSFTSKDSVDEGAYAAGVFYGFLKAYEGNLLTQENLDFVRFLFYWRALSIRERAADPEQFFRSISTLETWNKALEEQQGKMTRALNIEWVA